MTMSEVPRIVSADDHVVEPPDVWTSRLPAKYRDVGPREGIQKLAHATTADEEARAEVGEHDKADQHVN